MILFTCVARLSGSAQNSCLEVLHPAAVRVALPAQSIHWDPPDADMFASSITGSISLSRGLPKQNRCPAPLSRGQGCRECS
eukprot:270-Chlamydomonas_euryale.AAC.3